MRRLTAARHQIVTRVADAGGMDDFDHLHGIDLTLWVRLLALLLLLAGGGGALAGWAW